MPLKSPDLGIPEHDIDHVSWFELLSVIIARAYSHKYSSVCTRMQVRGSCATCSASGSVRCKCSDAYRPGAGFQSCQLDPQHVRKLQASCKDRRNVNPFPLIAWCDFAQPGRTCSTWIFPGTRSQSFQALRFCAIWSPSWCECEVWSDCHERVCTETKVVRECPITWSRRLSNGISSIPNSIGNLNNLEELNLSYNNIQTLPPAFKDLTKLRVLEMSGEYGSLTWYEPKGS